MSQQHDMENSQNPTESTQEPALDPESGAQASDGIFERLNSSEQLFDDGTNVKTSESSVEEAAANPGEDAPSQDSASSTQAAEADAASIEVIEITDESSDDVQAQIVELDAAADQAAASIELSQLRERYKALSARFSQLEMLHSQLEKLSEGQKLEAERKGATLKQELEALTAERDDLKNRVLRSAADLENFRKRKEREKDELRKYGSDRLVLEILPAVDNLERALEHADKSEDSSTIADGVRMVLRQLISGLEKHGVKGYSSLHERFDPQRHEAIQQIETPEFETGTVMQEFQKGYFLHDRLIRPALVVVAKHVAPAVSDVVDITPAQSEGDLEATSEDDDSAPILEEISAPHADATSEQAPSHDAQEGGEEPQA